MTLKIIDKYELFTIYINLISFVNINVSINL